MEKINVAKLLKDCPKGMELDCTIYDNLYFRCVREYKIYPIVCYTIDNNANEHEVLFNWYGGFALVDTAKCVIFPKGQTTWEGFVPPCKFKDWDILATDLGSVFYLNTRLNTDECYGCFVGIGGDGSFHICEPFAYKECCGFATEEEKQELLQAIKDNGYKWNEETKTLEKEEKKDKFDITSLKPFDKVLVRYDNDNPWVAAHFSHYTKDAEWELPYFASGTCFRQCIPFEGNEHVLGTTNDCDDFYKIW